MSGFELVESAGGFEVIAEIPGMYRIERFTGNINGHFVEVGKMDNSGRIDYSVRVDGRAVADSVSESEAQRALRHAVG